MSDIVAQIEAQLILEPSYATRRLRQSFDLLDASDWESLVPGAIARLQESRSELALDVILEVYFRHSAMLYAHLKELFDTPNYFCTKYSYMPWRGAGPEHIGYLREGLANPDRRDRAIGALLELRLPEAFALIPADTNEQAFADVGFVRRNGNVRQLYPENIYNLQFLPEYVENWQEWETRPETYREVAEYPYPFGGVVEGQFCPCCGDTLHHLLTFPAASLLPDVCSLPSLTLATCMHCLGWQESAMPLFLNHNEFGVPISPVPEEPQPCDFIYTPVEKTIVALTPVPEGFRWQEWTHSQNIHRLGGHPAWVQIGYYPDCPECGKAMSFILQLNSRLPLAQPNPDELEVMEWGSGGIAYFHWCDSCRISAGNWQCT